VGSEAPRNVAFVGFTTGLLQYGGRVVWGNRRNPCCDISGV